MRKYYIAPCKCTDVTHGQLGFKTSLMCDNYIYDTSMGVFIYAIIYKIEVATKL